MSEDDGHRNDKDPLEQDEQDAIAEVLVRVERLTAKAREIHADFSKRPL